MLVPELDGARLEARHRASEADRAALFDELAGAIARHARASAAREALRVLILGE